MCAAIVVLICGFVFVPHDYYSVDNSSPISLAVWIGICFFGSWFGVLVLALQVGTACLVQPVCRDLFSTSVCRQLSGVCALGRYCRVVHGSGTDALPEMMMLGVVPSVWAQCHGRGNTGIRCVIRGEKNLVWAKLVGAGWYPCSKTSSLFKSRGALFSQC